MWVRTYIAQLSATQAELYRNLARGTSHHGNSTAEGNNESRPPFQGGGNTVKWCSPVPTHCLKRNQTTSLYWQLPAALQDQVFPSEGIQLSKTQAATTVALILCVAAIFVCCASERTEVVFIKFLDKCDDNRGIYMFQVSRFRFKIFIYNFLRISNLDDSIL